MTALDKIGFEIEGEWGSELMSILKGEWGLAFHGDGSVHNCESRECTRLICAEANSIPILSDKADKLKPLFDLMQAGWGTSYHANKSAGFHVHASFTKFPSEIMSARFYALLTQRMSKEFPKEYEARKHNSFCKVPSDIEKLGGELMKKEVRYKREFKKADEHGWRDGNRYNAVNIRASWNERKTIEFRIFPACEPQCMYEMMIWLVDTINEFLEKDEFMFIFSKRIEKIDKVSSKKISRVSVGEGSFDTAIKLLCEMGDSVATIEKNGYAVRIGDDELRARVCKACKKPYDDCECEICSTCWKLEIVCTCTYCGCCEERIPEGEGCTCSICDNCERCTEHNDCAENCECEYCIEVRGEATTSV